MTDIEYIASRLSRENILCQLAEKAAALSEAALKLRRSMDGINFPASAAYVDAREELIAAIAAALEAEKAFIKDAANTNCAAVTPTVAPTDTPTAGGKTRQERFIEMFPRAARCKGVLDICPEKVDIRLRSCENYYDCLDCRKEFWLAAEKEAAE